jgi:uncharacterized Zn-binding protein involved in type VI secretion
MGIPAAKQGDQVIGVDTHIILVPSASGTVPTPIPHPFVGQLMQNLSMDVFFDNRPAATVGSVALNMPPHIPQGGAFQTPPNNQGTIERGSMTVKINGKDAARVSDPATTCNDIGMKFHSNVIVPFSTVFIGNGGPDPAALSMPWK